MITDIKVLDNFYTNPEYIILSIGSIDAIGCGSMIKSADLEQINPQLNQEIKNALCNIHGVDPSQIGFNTYFSEETYSEIDDIFNHKTIHIDGKGSGCSIDNYRLAFCGEIMLTKNPDPESGVCIYNLNDDVDSSFMDITLNHYTLPREKYEAGEISLEEFKNLRMEYNKNFNLTCDVKNVYNRMVSWKGGTLHGQKVTKQVPKKLTQYFFAEWI